MNVYFILHILLKVAFSDDVFFINYFEVFKTVMNSRVVGIQRFVSHSVLKLPIIYKNRK